MKSSSYHFLALLIPAALGAQPQQVPVDPDCCGNDPEGTILEIRNSASSEAVQARRSAASTGYERASIRQVEEKVEIKKPNKSFLAGSEFLLGAQGFTILPKGASVSDGRGIQKVSEAPTEAKLQNWQEFQRANRAVVRELAVTEKMLNGEKTALNELRKKLAALKGSGVLYVTMLNGNPVSLPAFAQATPK